MSILIISALCHSHFAIAACDLDRLCFIQEGRLEMEKAEQQKQQQIEEVRLHT